MKKHLLNITLGAALAACIVWAAAAPGLQAWIPMILAIVLGLALLNVNHRDYIKTI